MHSFSLIIYPFAQHAGDREAALKHMAASKGIEQMIKAAEAEAPIDMNEVGFLLDYSINNRTTFSLF